MFKGGGEKKQESESMEGRNKPNHGDERGGRGKKRNFLHKLAAPKEITQAPIR